MMAGMVLTIATGPCCSAFTGDVGSHLVTNRVQVPECQPLAEVFGDGDEEQVREPCQELVRDSVL